MGQVLGLDGPEWLGGPRVSFPVARVRVFGPPLSTDDLSAETVGPYTGVTGGGCYTHTLGETYVLGKKRFIFFLVGPEPRNIGSNIRKLFVVLL